MINEFSYREPVTVTIANAQSLSGAIDLEKLGLQAIDMPDAWTAASLTFQVSEDGVTFLNLYDNSGEVTITTAASRRVILPKDIFSLGFRYLKVRSGTAGAAVNQAAERVLTLIKRPV